jgi:hypothetical protein
MHRAKKSVEEIRKAIIAGEWAGVSLEEVPR